MPITEAQGEQIIRLLTKILAQLEGERSAIPSPSGRILKLAEVQTRTGLKHSAIYERINDGTFPRPVPLGPQARGFLESEINEWIEQRVAEREAKP